LSNLYEIAKRKQLYPRGGRADYLRQCNWFSISICITLV